MTEKQHEVLEVDEEFLEHVLEEQQKALEEERQRRLHPVKKKPRRALKLIAYIIAFSLVFNTFAIIFQIYSIPAIEFLKVSSELSKQDNIKAWQQSIVEVSTGSSKGTGFAISEDGYILTNAHVVDDALSVTIVFPNDTLYKADIISSDAGVDLALLKVNASKPLPSLTLAKESPPNGEEIYVIGNPLYFTNIANKGVIHEEIMLDDWQQPVRLLQAPIYKGNSGSPVLQQDGQVIGAVFATTKYEPYGRVGLFIPIEVVHQFLAKIER